MSTKNTHRLVGPVEGPFQPVRSDDVLDATDERYTILDIKEPKVRRALEYRGYVCRHLDPYGFWTVENGPMGNFTGLTSLFEAIDTHIRAKHEEQVR